MKRKLLKFHEKKVDAQNDWNVTFITVDLLLGAYFIFLLFNFLMFTMKDIIET